MITNIGNKDEGLRLYGSDSWYGSRVFDLSGNEYLAVAAQMGLSQNAQYADVELIRNIPTRANVRFELPLEVSDMALLKVDYHGGTGNHTNVQFRDVAITVP